MATGYIDATGSHIPEYQIILDDLKTQVRAIYGEDLYLEADSKDGQFLGVFALAIFDCYQQAESVYNSFSPTTSQGNGLSSRVSINGIARKIASNSSVEVLIKGQAGTVINNGVCEDAAGNKWLLPTLVTIPVNAQIFVLATATDVGDIYLAPNTLAKIATPTKGWISVTNPQAATVGNAVESDAQLRVRQKQSTNIPSQSILSGIGGAIANLAGVSKWRAYENDTNVASNLGIPPHSISLVIEGGDTQEIGGIINLKKTPGCGTFGTTSVTVKDKYEEENTINFFRPTVIDLQIKLVLQPVADYTNDVEPIIKQNLVDYISNIEIGGVVYVNRLECIVNGSEFIAGKISFDIVSLEIGKKGETLAPANIELLFSEEATLSLADIDITVG